MWESVNQASALRALAPKRMGGGTDSGFGFVLLCSVFGWDADATSRAVQDAVELLWVQPLFCVARVSVLTATVTGGEACGYLCSEGEGFKCS